MKNLNHPIAILGAGSWGTALALYLARKGDRVQLWAHTPSHANEMSTLRQNKAYLPNEMFPETLQVTSALASAIKDTQDILIAVPSSAFRETLIALKPLLSPHHRLVWATKGLDQASGKMLHHVSAEVLANTPCAALSGPSFAHEVAKGLPTAVVIASADEQFADDLTQRFNSNSFRIYSSTDITGVEVGGIVKNVLAIASGITDGMQLGANARSALITRGLAEMIRLGLALGGQHETFTGLAGLGDLILTCTDNQSRNRRFGLALGAGKTVSQAKKEIGQVIEGERNTELVMQLAKQNNIEMPITAIVQKILRGEITPQQAAQNLLSRAPKTE